MAVHVNIPVRLRIDPGAISQADDAIQEALAEAVGRALGQAREAALAPRAGRPLRCHRPSIHWYGAGLDLVDRADCARTERIVHKTIAKAVSPLLGARRRGPEPLSEEASEPFDPDRMEGDHYVIDSYQQDGKRRPGKSTIWFRNLAEYYANVKVDEEVGNWWFYEGDAALAEIALDTWKKERRDAGIPDGDMFGIGYYRAAPNGGIVIWVAMFRPAGGSLQIVANFPIGNPGGYQVVPKKGAKPGKKVDFTPNKAYAIGLYTLTRLASSGSHYDTILGYWSKKLGIARGHPNWPRLERATSMMVADSFHPNGSVGFLNHDNVSWSVTFPVEVPDRLVVIPIMQVRPLPPKAEVQPADGGGSGADGAEQKKKGKDQEGGGGGSSKKDAGSGGKGTSSGGGTGDGSGAEAAAAGDKRPPPIAIVQGAEGKPGGSLLPAAKVRGKTPTVDLSPFRGEPSVDELGDIGRAMRLLIRRIAFRLEMEEGVYAGAFALEAARIVAGRATGAADYGVGEGQSEAARPATKGNLGPLNFQPGESQALRVMHHLGGTVPLITQLASLVMRIALNPELHRKFSPEAPDGGTWALRFREIFYPRIENSIIWIFVASCQVIMLQLLGATRAALNDRQVNIDTYFPMVQKLALGLLEGEAELHKLRDELRSEAAWSMMSPGAAVRETYTLWRDARLAVTDAFGMLDTNESTLIAVAPRRAGPRIFELPNGQKVIEDRKGRRWTIGEIEQAIGMRSQIAMSIDPIVQHITDLPAAVDLLRKDPEAGKIWLNSLLDDLLSANDRVRKKSEESALWAFRASPLREDIEHRTVPGTAVVLQGLQKLAHEALGDAFRGEEYYAFALDHLFSHELGRKSLIEFAEMAGPLMLGVICPPAGIVAGIAVAGVNYFAALRLQDIPKSVLEPDVVLSRADAEFELFMAEFGFAMAVIPELKSGLQAAQRTIMSMEKQGIRAGARAAMHHYRRQLLVSVLRAIRQDLPVAIAKAVASDQVVGHIVSYVIGPAFEEVATEIYASHGQFNTAPAAAGPQLDPEEAAGLTPLEAELLYELQGTPEGDDGL